jgi:arachidonate 15-lipoxygenase
MSRSDYQETDNTVHGLLCINRVAFTQRQVRNVTDKAEQRAGNMFVLDYTGVKYMDGRRPDFLIPEDWEPGDYEETDSSPAKRVMPRPLAFFRWVSASDPDAANPVAETRDGQLMPVAIRVTDGPDARIYTPPAQGTKGYDWLFAKLCVQIADFNCHEMQTHLGKTHLTMEPFAVATRLELPDEHPLGVFLRAHMRFMIANNHLAREYLIAPKVGFCHNASCVLIVSLCDIDFAAFL